MTRAAGRQFDYILFHEEPLKMAQATVRHKPQPRRIEKRAAGVAIVTSLLFICFLVERHAQIAISSLQSGLYLGPPEVFDSDAGSLSGEDFEWPYVWDAGSSQDPSGYDWLGSTYDANPRGLDMPPSHDVFGELQDNGPQDQSVEHDEIVPAGSLPGATFQRRSPTAQLWTQPVRKFARQQALLQQASTSLLTASALSSPVHDI